MTAFRSSVPNAGAAPFYAPYTEKGEKYCTSAPRRPEQESGYFHFSNIARGLGRADVSSSQPSTRGVFAVLGGILVHICLGTVYTWGTLAVYVISYMRLLQEEQFTDFSTAEAVATHEEDVTGHTVAEEIAPAGVATVRLSDAAWVVACQFAGMALAMPLGGKVERKVGPSRTVLAGGAVMCAAVAAAPYVLHNYLLFLACYGLMQGAGLGIAYTAPLVCSLSWFPHRKGGSLFNQLNTLLCMLCRLLPTSCVVFTGVVSGAITAGFGTGALLFSPLQATYLNPLNVPPTSAPYPNQPAELYYDPNDAEERAVLLRIPSLFRRLALAYMLLLGAGAALLQPPASAGYRDDIKARAAGSRTSNNSIPDSGRSTKRDRKKRFLPPVPTESGDVSYKAAAATVEGEDDAEFATSPDNDAEDVERIEERLEKLRVWKALRSRPFLSLWGLFFVNGLAICFTASFWRFLAIDRVYRTYILSEAQLAVVGAAASASNAAGRIAWGQVVDVKGFKVALMLLAAWWSGLLLYLPYSALHGGLAYGATVCGCFFCLGGNFAIFPSAVAALFGRDAIGHLYGYMFTSQLASSLCFAFLTQRIVQALGTDGLCTLMGLCCLASAGAAAFLPSSYAPHTRRNYGEERKEFFAGAL